MKRIAILKKVPVTHIVLPLFAWIFALPATAGNGNDTIIHHGETKRYTVKESRIVKKRKYCPDLFLDLGYNRLDKSNMFTGTSHTSAADFPKLHNSLSKSFSMYAMFGQKIGGPLSIMSGLGIDWVNYRFSSEATVKETDGIAAQAPIKSIISGFSFMHRSKLTGSYLNVPLLFKLKFHRLFIAAGVTGGLNIGSHTKIVFTDTNGKKQTYKDYDIHLATFRYGYTVRAGFRHLSLFANYYVSPLFVKNEGPQVYPLSIGISLKL